MKKMFLFIAFIFTLAVMPNVVDVGNKSDDVNISVVDVGQTAQAIIIQSDVTVKAQQEIAQTQSILSSTETNWLPDYQDIADASFDMGIGKQVKIDSLAYQNTLLKEYILKVNADFNDLNYKYRRLYFNVNGTLPNSVNHCSIQ